MNKNIKATISKLKESRKYIIKQIILINLYTLTCYIATNLTTLIYFKFILNCAIIGSIICTFKKIINIIKISQKLKKYKKEQQTITLQTNSSKNIQNQKNINNDITSTKKNTLAPKGANYKENYNIEEKKLILRKKPNKHSNP